MSSTHRFRPSPISFTSLTGTGRFLYANKALLNLWGLTLEAAGGKNFFDLKAGLAAKLQRQIQQVFASREGLSDETTYTSPTGTDGHYEYIFSPVIVADGAVEAVAGSTRDITERSLIATVDRVKAHSDHRPDRIDRRAINQRLEQICSW